MRNWIRTLLLVSAVSLAGSAQTPGGLVRTGNNPFASPGLGESIAQSGIVEKTAASETQSIAMRVSGDPALVGTLKPSVAGSWQATQQNPPQPTISNVQNAPSTTNQNGYVRPSASARFNKYVKNIFGPWALARHAAFAAIS